MSKSKDSEATDSILSYLVTQNRPYSAIDVFNNLHKAFGKTLVTRVLEQLAESKKVKEKVYGKQKVYFADQTLFETVNDEEMKQMDATIATLSQQVKESSDCVRKLQTDIQGLHNELTTDDLKSNICAVGKECNELREKLLKLENKNVQFSPEHRDKIKSQNLLYQKEWRKRKRMAMSITDAVLEGYPKSKKQLYEEIGIETDEDNNAVL